MWEWEQNHRAPVTYVASHTYVIRFIKMSLDSKCSADRKHRKQSKTKQ